MVEPLVERQARYAPQLAEYRTPAALLTGLEISEVRCLLLFAAAGRLVEA